MLTAILKILTDFADSAGWLIAAVLFLSYGRRIVRENDKAHAVQSQDVKTLDRKVDALENKVDALENKVDSLENKVDSLENKVDALDRKVDAAVARLDSKIDSVKATLGTKIDALTKDISFLVGRQTERDRQS